MKRKWQRIDVSPGLISFFTETMLEEGTDWQNRPLDWCYPIVFFDAIRVMNELKNRGLNDILIAVVDAAKALKTIH